MKKVHPKSRSTLVNLADFRNDAPASDDAVPPLSREDILLLAAEFDDQARECLEQAARYWSDAAELRIEAERAEPTPKRQSKARRLTVAGGSR